MALGNKIQSLREEHSLSQKELANLVGVTTGTIAEWEAGESDPNLAELSRLSKALNVSSDVLLDATAEAIPTPMITPKQEPVPVIAPAKKRNGKGWIIAVAVLCVALIAAVVVLWSQGVFTPEPLLFSENTAKIEAADASVVTIFCYDYEGELAATGSGFVAFDGKTIITNYHVMTSAYTCKISTNQDISYEVSKILCYSKDQDIAILQLSKDTGLQPLTLGDSSIVKKGETVVAIGSPLGIKNTVSTGNLSGRLMDTNMDVLQFTAPISSGSSGGALFDNNGNVIGITFASYDNGQNLNLAIPIELAVELYDAKGTAKSVSTICVEEYPYITFLSEYKNAPVVTLADLKRNPQKYDETIVRLSIFVSSWGKDSQYEWQKGNWYLTEKQYVSGNYEDDQNLAIPLRLGVSYENSPVLTCYTDYDRSKYVDETIIPGDRIEVIAYFEFCPEGESIDPDDPECEIYWEYDFASLEAVVIWKS